MATPEITKNTSNPFDAPIPGQSLTDTPGNYPWEHPSQFTTVEEASEYIWDRLHDTQMAEQVITMLKNEVPVEALSRMVLFGGFAEGKWNPDLAILLAEIVFKQIIVLFFFSLSDKTENCFKQSLILSSSNSKNSLPCFTRQLFNCFIT